MVFARRDGHHTRQPETIQEFPGDWRPSLHKMSSLSIAGYLGGDLPPSLPLTLNWFLITDFFFQPEGREIAGGGIGEAEEGNGRAGSGRRWCGELEAGENRPRGQGSREPGLHKAGA